MLRKSRAVETSLLFAVLALATAVLLPACCRTVHCRVSKSAAKDLECDRSTLEISDITLEVKKFLKNEQIEGQYRKVKGCRQIGFYECSPVSKAGEDIDTYRGEQPRFRKVGDSSWHCWKIDDPLSPPPKKDTPDID